MPAARGSAQRRSALCEWLHPLAGAETGANTPARKARAPQRPPNPCRPPGSESLVPHVVSARSPAAEVVRGRGSTRWREKSPAELGREQECPNKWPVRPNEDVGRRKNRSVAAVEEHRCARKLRAILRASPRRRLQRERGSSTALRAPAGSG